MCERFAFVRAQLPAGTVVRKPWRASWPVSQVSAGLQWSKCDAVICASCGLGAWAVAHGLPVCCGEQQQARPERMCVRARHDEIDIHDKIDIDESPGVGHQAERLHGWRRSWLAMGQKAALGPIGAFDLGARVFHVLLKRLAVGDVADRDGGEDGRFAVNAFGLESRARYGVGPLAWLVQDTGWIQNT
ncbi:MAG: hypothetical protein IRZ28_13410 [Steroidobacteraceae bacterium]|nr:hypothetical protein [Steroidobacteraceae bacterium]